MAFSLQAAAQSITARFRDEVHQEAREEGVPAQKVEWTGNYELRDNQLWVQVKMTDEEYRTYITGWTNGAKDGMYITFQED